MKRITVVIFCVIVGITYSQITFAQDTQGRLSVTDKEIIERLTRVETKLEALNQRIGDVNTGLGKRIDDTNRRIDDLQATMHWGFGILFTMFIALFGYIVWDRRTALMPVVKSTEELKISNALVLKALKEYARKEPKLAEVLKSIGIF